MTKLNAQQTLSAARGIALKYLPYFSSALYSLIPHETHREPTLAVTERAVLLYNPDYVLKLGPKYTAAVLVHEVNHLLREHMKRFRRKVLLGRLSRIAGKQLDGLAMLWNLAADAEINDGQPPELPLPPGCILPSTYGLPSGKLAEWYFDQLRRQQQKQQSPDQGSGGAEDDDSEEDSDGSGGAEDDDSEEDSDGSQGGSGGAGDDDSEEDSDGSQGGSGDAGDDDSQGVSGDAGDDDSEEGTPDLGPGHGHCGSCAGHRKPSEPADGKLGEEGRSDAELERIKDDVARDVIEHEKTYGKGSAGLLWWAQDRLKPAVVRWEQQLASLTRQAVAYREGMLDYRDDIPSPEQSALGWGPDIPLLPALVAPVPETMFLVDRSGSMTSPELTSVAQEVPAILRALSTPLNFGSFDTRVQEIQKVATVQAALKLFTGGGGTDFRPIFEALKQMKKNRPSVLIIGTDGCGPAPAEPPKGVSVIWLLVGKYAQKPTIGHTGTTIRWGKSIFTNPELRAKHTAAAA